MTSRVIESGKRKDKMVCFGFRFLKKIKQSEIDLNDLILICWSKFIWSGNSQFWPAVLLLCDEINALVLTGRPKYCFHMNVCSLCLEEDCLCLQKKVAQLVHCEVDKCGKSSKGWFICNSVTMICPSQEYHAN